MKRKIFMAAAYLLLFFSVSVFALDNDIVILYTNDIHCGIHGTVGYSGMVAYRNGVKAETPYVVTVDNGDAIQGEVIGTVSKGDLIIDIMNEAGFDYAIIGNHEFDYGMDVLESDIKKASYKYLNANITYKGKKKTSFVDLTQPYDIRQFDDKKVAFIGVTTPGSITSSTPTFFMEGKKYAYDFEGSKNGKKLYARIQKYVNECRGKGADYVILLSHLGDLVTDDKSSSRDVIANTYGIDAVLDGHAHSVIPCEILKDKNGADVILTSTGTKFEWLGKFVISKEGKLSSELIGKEFTDKDSGIVSYINGIEKTYESEVRKVVAHINTALSISGADGIRQIRNREMPIGDFCADAYRYVAKSDIAFVNGGGIRAPLAAGDVTYEDVIKIHPYGNMLTVVEATGQQIADALEFSVRYTAGISSENGKGVGEFGGFEQVSGLKFTVDTSVPSSLEVDDKGMFVKVNGARRIKDIHVEVNGKYVPLDLTKKYSVASHDYMLLNSGDGYTMFKNCKVLLKQIMIDNQVLITYMMDGLKGDLSRYSSVGDRITVK